MKRDFPAMSLLRDIELRLHDGPAASDWFWRRLPSEYLFYRQLRALKIVTPKVMKVSVCCVSGAKPYDGDLWDGVASIEVDADVVELEKLQANELSQRCTELMVAGVKKVLSFFDVPDAGVDAAAERALADLGNFSLPVGKAVKHPGGNLSAQVHVRVLENLHACIAVVVLKAGRKTLGDVSICTTFPFPESALDGFKWLAWTGKPAVQICFGTAGPLQRTVFGRANFDCSGLDHVKLVSQTDPVEPFFARELVFEVEIAELIKGRQ